MNRNRTTKGKIILAVIIAILAILLFWLGLTFITGRLEQDEQFGDTGDWGESDDGYETVLTFADKDYCSNDDVEAYVIAGTDLGGVDQGEGFNGELADFIVVLLIDATTEKFAFYPIDRNTMVDVPVINENGDIQNFAYEQICTSHWYGKDAEQRNQNLMNSVTDALGGLDMSGYYVISMADIAQLNDAIGGVTVDIDEDMTNLDPAFTAGSKVHLDGKQAEHYLRARMNVGDGTNAARMARQQQYMQNAYNMVTDQLRENPAYLSDLYDQLQGKVQSDGNDKRVSVITNKLMSYRNMGIINFKGEVRTGDAINEGKTHEEFYVDESSVLAGLRKVMDIQEYDGE